MSDYPYDVFVSHATEDKSGFVDALVHALEGAGLLVWYDSSALAPGDHLDENVRFGIERSRFSVVVLSEHSMSKPWTRLEAELAMERPERVVPVWHGVDPARVQAFNPVLANQLALSSTDGPHVVALKLLKHMRIHHEASEPVIEHYHGSVRVVGSPKPDHYVEILEVGGVFRVPRGKPLVYADMITNSSPDGSIDFFDTVPANTIPAVPGQRFRYFNLPGPEHASVMPICGLMHATKKFTQDDGFVALRLPYFTKFVTLTFDYSGLSFDIDELTPRIVAQSAEAVRLAQAPTVVHWPDRRYAIFQARDLPQGSNPMLGWGKWGSAR